MALQQDGDPDPGAGEGRTCSPALDLPSVECLASIVPSPSLCGPRRLDGIDLALLGAAALRRLRTGKLMLSAHSPAARMCALRHSLGHVRDKAVGAAAVCAALISTTMCRLRNYDWAHPFHCQIRRHIRSFHMLPHGQQRLPARNRRRRCSGVPSMIDKRATKGRRAPEIPGTSKGCASSSPSKLPRPRAGMRASAPRPEKELVSEPLRQTSDARGLPSGSDGFELGRAAAQPRPL